MSSRCERWRRRLTGAALALFLAAFLAELAAMLYYLAAAPRLPQALTHHIYAMPVVNGTIVYLTYGQRYWLDRLFDVDGYLLLIAVILAVPEKK